jgi:hypothetical protein
MAYVPGFNNDLFVSYSHGDDRAWIRNFYETLKPALKDRLGVAPNVWIDESTLGRSEDFRREIPEELKTSALFLFLVSPQYLQSAYGVDVECKEFASTITQKRARFNTAEFRNQLFAFRAPIVRIENNEHWKLIEGLTDYTFYDDGGFPIPLVRSGSFETEFRRLVRDISALLRRMRNLSTPVFLYPRDPGPDIAEAHRMLTQELQDSEYRIAPDNLVAIEQKMHESALSVFLVGGTYDQRMRELTDAIAVGGGPWVVWESPAAATTEDQDQMMFLAYLDGVKSPRRSYFDSRIRPDQLKREVIDLLRPATRVVATEAKRRVALVYDFRKRGEVANASQIRFRWDREFDFELPAHGLPPKPANSDAALLVWGQAEESWCSDQFARLESASLKGLCVFDPEKRQIIDQIRSAGSDWHISEHYGGFDPRKLDTFFHDLRNCIRTASTAR